MISTLIVLSSAWVAVSTSPVLLQPRAIFIGTCAPVSAVVGVLNLYAPATPFCSTWLHVQTRSTSTTITSTAPKQVTTTFTTGTNLVTAKDTVTITTPTTTITADPSVILVTTDIVTLLLDTSTIIATSTVSVTSTVTSTVCATGGVARRDTVQTTTKAATETTSKATSSSSPKTSSPTVNLKVPYTGPLISTCPVPSTKATSTKKTSTPPTTTTGKGSTKTLNIITPLRALALTKISTICSCLNIPTPTVTKTYNITVTRTTTQTISIAASSTVTPTSTLVPTTIVTPTTKSIVTPTTTVIPTTTTTSVTSTTIMTTTTIILGAVTGTPSVVLPSPTPITGVDSNGLATAYADDLPTYAVTLPFAVQLYGTTTNVVHISVNGWLSLTSDVDYDEIPSQLPVDSPNEDFDLPDTCFLPFWNDLFIYKDTPQGLYYEIDGQAPNRTVSFEWYVDLYGNPRHYNHFLATYHEAVPNSIVYNYIQVDPAKPGDIGFGSFYATVGAQGRTGGMFAQYTVNKNPAITPRMELTLDPVTNTFVRTNAVYCPFQTT